MSVVNNLLVGLAVLIDGAGIGVWSPTADYTDGQVGISLAAVLQAPDELIILTPYLANDDPTTADTMFGVQVRHRTGSMDPRPAWDRDDAVFNLLESLQSTTVGPVPVAACWRVSSTPLGFDENDRYEHASSYYVRTAYPTAHRPD